MGKFFDLDGPLLGGLTKIADIIILNILFLVCSLPVFTAGAAYTALYYVTLKMVKNEDCYTVKSFFKSFKLNFKQATVIWLILLLIGVVFFYDLKIVSGNMSYMMPLSDTMRNVLMIIMMSCMLIYSFTLVYVFPVLSRFDNSVKNTMKNALLMAVRHFPQTIAVIAVTFLPLVFMYFVPRAIIFVFVIFSLSAYINSYMFVKIFSKYMPEETITRDEDFEISVSDDENKQ